MVMKVALVSITVVRGNKPQTVAPGEALDFTEEEIAGFDEMEARHVKSEQHLTTKTPFRAIVRDPVVEVGAEDGAAVTAPVAAQAKGGKKSAPADL